MYCTRLEGNGSRCERIWQGSQKERYCHQIQSPPYGFRHTAQARDSFIPVSQTLRLRKCADYEGGELCMIKKSDIGYALFISPMGMQMYLCTLSMKEREWHGQMLVWVLSSRMHTHDVNSLRHTSGRTSQLKTHLSVINLVFLLRQCFFFIVFLLLFSYWCLFLC